MPSAPGRISCCACNLEHRAGRSVELNKCSAKHECRLDENDATILLNHFKEGADDCRGCSNAGRAWLCLRRTVTSGRNTEIIDDRSSRGQAFGMDYDFLSPRAARGKRTNDFVSGAIDMLVAAVTLLVNALMLAIALYSVISAGPLAVSQAFGTFGVPSEVAAPSAYNFAVDCQGSRRLPCGR